MGYPCSSDPWARCFGDMLIPALCPGHASQCALPSTGRLPSTVSVADVTRHCSRLLRYSAAVRLLIRVHAHRTAVAFMDRSGVLAGRGLPGSVQRTSPRAWGLRQREAPRPQAIFAGRMDVAFSSRERDRHLGIRPVYRKPCPECSGTGHVTPTRRQQLLQKMNAKPRGHRR
jgi:hypothetical protein